MKNRFSTVCFYYQINLALCHNRSALTFPYGTRDQLLFIQSLKINGLIRAYSIHKQNQKKFYHFRIFFPIKNVRVKKLQFVKSLQFFSSSAITSLTRKKNSLLYPIFFFKTPTGIFSDLELFYNRKLKNVSTGGRLIAIGC